MTGSKSEIRFSLNLFEPDEKGKHENPSDSVTFSASLDPVRTWRFARTLGLTSVWVALSVLIENEQRMIGEHYSMRLRQYPSLFVLALLCFLGSRSVAISQVPSGSESDNGNLANVVRLGEAIVNKTTTHSMSKNYVGNSLNCTSCHLKNGRHPSAGTFLGTATAYPAWSPREKRVITLEDRVLNCFMRSCNGTRPPLGSEVSVAVTSYITSLSEGMPVMMNAKRPVGPGAIKQLPVKSEQANVSRGASLYASRCADCHRDNGQGDKDNPPVWGERSYNDGAGLSSVDGLAAWLKVSMPLDETDLSNEEALDIAAYINSHKRPHFELNEHLPGAERLGEYNASAAK